MIKYFTQKCSPTNYVSHKRSSTKYVTKICFSGNRNVSLIVCRQRRIKSRHCFFWNNTCVWVYNTVRRAINNKTKKINESEFMCYLPHVFDRRMSCMWYLERGCIQRSRLTCPHSRHSHRRQRSEKEEYFLQDVYVSRYSRQSSRSKSLHDDKAFANM